MESFILGRNTCAGPRWPEITVEPVMLKVYSLCLLLCFTVWSSGHFLWLIIHWYAVARTPAPSEMNKQGTGGSFSDQGCWFLSAPLRYILWTPTVSFTASLYIRLCLPAKRRLGHDSEKKEWEFRLLHWQADLRHPVEPGWKAKRGQRCSAEGWPRSH